MTYSQDEKYMARCLQLAMNGEGSTYPNPLVGSVIVHNGKIIGEGFHRKAGEPHAEVNAINSVRNNELFKESTLYVNLEPCAHFGRTPPCSLAIINHKIPRVVIGCVDTFSEVSGKGIEMMRKAGVEVKTGVLEQESRYLNRRFFTFHEKNRPFVMLKWARTLDGFIDIHRETGAPAQPTWITNEWARRSVHKQRSTEQAILIGTNTALKDDPSLTLRNWKGNSPKRVVIDKGLKLPRTFKVFSGNEETIVLNEIKNGQENNVLYVKKDLSNNGIDNILSALKELEIQSVVVEGGRQTLESFIRSGLWDEAFVYTGEKWFGKGVRSPILEQVPEEKHEFGSSKLFVYRNMS